MTLDISATATWLATATTVRLGGMVLDGLATERQFFTIQHRTQRQFDGSCFAIQSSSTN